MTSNVATAASMGLREFRRTPVLVALLLVLPAYFVGIFVLVVPDATVPLTLDGATVHVSMDAFAAAFMTPVAVGILSGVVGLFLILGSKTTDSRLQIAGFGGAQLVAARIAELAVAVAVVTAVSVAVTLQVFAPRDTLAFAAATAAVGLTYGVIGILAGLLFDRLAGVYAMLFVPMVDVLLFQNPLATDLPGWTAYLPAHYATTAAFDVAFTAGTDVETAVGALAYGLLCVAVSGVVFYWSTVPGTD